MKKLMLAVLVLAVMAPALTGCSRCKCMKDAGTSSVVPSSGTGYSASAPAYDEATSGSRKSYTK